MPDTTTQSTERVVRVLSAAYFTKTINPDGNPARLSLITRRGDTVPVDDLADGELDRLERLGALMPEGASKQDAFEDRQGRLDYYRGQRGDQEALQRSMVRAAKGQVLKDTVGGIVDLSTPGSDASETPVASADATVPELADKIRDEKLTAEQTVALAENDPELALRVLEAERLASNDAPRAEVEQGLEKIVDGSTS